MRNEIIRAGVIPYTIREEGELWFLLGIDRRHPYDLSDFGGGVKSGETSAQGAARELAEESLGVFRPSGWDLEKDFFFEAPIVKMGLFFRRVTDFEGVTSSLLQAVRNATPGSEMRGFVWLTEIHLRYLISGRALNGFSLYSLVRTALKSIGNFIDELKRKQP